MKKQKPQHFTVISSKVRNFIFFICVTGITLYAFVLLIPDKPNIFTLALFLLLLIPTLIALFGAPFVPTPMHGCRIMLKIGDVKKGDKVVDIGCGDGRLVYLAANEIGATAVGYELSPVIYAIAKLRKLLWRSKAKITFGDFRRHKLNDVDQIVCYMLPETLEKYIPKFEKELKKGAKIISYAFKIGDWKPLRIEPPVPDLNVSKIYVYEMGNNK